MVTMLGVYWRRLFGPPIPISEAMRAMLHSRQAHFQKRRDDYNDVIAFQAWQRNMLSDIVEFTRDHPNAPNYIKVSELYNTIRHTDYEDWRRGRYTQRPLDLS